MRISLSTTLTEDHVKVRLSTVREVPFKKFHLCDPTFHTCKCYENYV